MYLFVISRDTRQHLKADLIIFAQKLKRKLKRLQCNLLLFVCYPKGILMRINNKTQIYYKILIVDIQTTNHIKL